MKALFPYGIQSGSKKGTEEPVQDKLTRIVQDACHKTEIRFDLDLLC
jgi:hypothetical protein